MQTSDYFGFGAVFIWGLWWITFPGSVIKFYTRFHRGKVKLPREVGVRLAGAAWLFLAIVVLFAFLHKKASIQ